MIRLLEIAVFGGLAALLHLGLALDFQPKQGLSSAGAGGEALLTLRAAPAQIATMVDRWEQPPDAPQDMPQPMPAPQTASNAPVIPLKNDLPHRPDLPERIALSDAAKTAPPKPPSAAPPPKPRAKPPAIPPALAAKAAAPSPKARPAERAQKSASGTAAQKASGAGGGAQAGQGARQKAATISQGQEAKLITVWGGQIRARIDRAKRYPSNARGKGRVVLRLTLRPDGKITSAGIAKSSGNAAFDKAALTAVSRAGRLPKAPRGLTKAHYTFQLPIAFQ
ncbi:MAG: energy transducer TonB family protein [Paracoccaceae bacterium]